MKPSPSLLPLLRSQLQGETGGRMSLAEARRGRRITPEITEEYAAARLRFELGEAVRGRRLGLSQSALGRGPG